MSFGLPLHWDPFPVATGNYRIIEYKSLTGKNPSVVDFIL